MGGGHKKEIKWALILELGENRAGGVVSKMEQLIVTQHCTELCSICK